MNDQIISGKSEKFKAKQWRTTAFGAPTGAVVLSNSVIAENYARRGWHVLPLHHVRIDLDPPDTVYEGEVEDDMHRTIKCACGDSACARQGKHPIDRSVPHGHLDASSETSVIKDWWFQNPIANIGIRTGRESGLVVIDIDDKSGRDGFATLKQLEQRFGKLPNTATVKTPSWGEHRYYRYPAEADIKIQSGTDKPGVGIDLRADGGYVVAPGSAIWGGYRWTHSFEDTPIADLPEAWLAAIISRQYVNTPSMPQRWDEETKRTLEDSLKHISASPYDDWIKVGLALHHASGGAEDAYSGWSKWSATSPKYDENECRKKWDSFSAGHSNPVGLGTIFHLAKQGGWVCSTPQRTMAQAVRLATTDYGNAERLVLLHGEDLRYIPAFGKWIVFDGARWVFDEDGEIMRRAKATARAIYQEASQEGDDGRRALLAKHATKSESADRLSAMINLARSESGIPLATCELDADPMLLGVNNGTLDLRDGTLNIERRGDYITKRCHVDHDPAAQCPTWESVLIRVFHGNQDLINFFQRAVGYTLTGRTDEQCLFLLHGSGANGKSTLVNTIQTILADYATTAQASTFMVQQRGSGASSDIARLRGARMVCASETDDGQRLSEALVKQLTGQDKVTARFLYAEHFEYIPQFKIWLVANHKPVIRGDDHAIWRRIHLIPFEVQIPEGERDGRLADKLAAELPGILNWALKGCIDWQRQGLQPPTEVKAATADYRKDMDILQEFLDAHVVFEAGATVRAKTLYEAYKGWAEETGHRVMNRTVFGRKLAERGVKKCKAGPTRTIEYQGIRANCGE